MHVVKVATGQLAYPKVLTAADTSDIQSGTASEAEVAGADLQLPSKLHLHLCAKRDSERHSLHVWARIVISTGRGIRLLHTVPRNSGMHADAVHPMHKYL
jgi:hypothetical protein